MKSIGMTEVEQKSIFRFLSAILYLGNIQFEANRDGNAIFSTKQGLFIILLKEGGENNG